MKNTSLALAITLTLGTTSVFADNKETTLTKSDCEGIVSNAIDGAIERDSDFRPDPATTKMQIYCMDRRGNILAYHNMDDAWVGSIDIAKAKAYTAASLSSDENALTSRDIGVASQPLQALWQVGSSNRPGTQGPENIKEHGYIEFPGGVPLYKGGKLVGGLGVSGDSVNADETVAVCGAIGFEPAIEIKSSTVLGLPYTTQICSDTGS